jgi:hypothetical protein
MVDHAVGTAVIHRADFQVTFEFTEGLLHLQQTFVVGQHLFVSATLGRFIGVQQVPAILLGFLRHEFLLARPLQPTGRVHFIGKILVGFAPLQTTAHLAGELFGIRFLAPDGGQRPQRRLGFGQLALAPFPIPLLPPQTAGSHIESALMTDFQQPSLIAQSQVFFQPQFAQVRFYWLFIKIRGS